MREPPKIQRPSPGTLRAEGERMICDQMERLAQWMYETAQEVASATQLQRPESQEQDGVWERATNTFHPMPKRDEPRSKRCPDCTDTQPCKRARELSGG